MIWFIIPFISIAQDLNGTWQGVMITSGQDLKDGALLYASFQIENGQLSGIMREEKYDTDLFAVKSISGSSQTNALKFDQKVILKNKRSTSVKWCRMKGKLIYDKKTGYLSGSFISTDCKRVQGEIILYQSDLKINENESIDVSHIWFQKFIADYKDGLSAPKIRDLERKNFKFEPVYFDYDKSEIKPEFESFLERLVKVVKGHSDLRVKVTGHTDSDGSFEYNDGLSQRRAQAIIDYFVKNGLSSDRLEFDFKGERAPASSNDSPEGRQQNRRVDFSFI